MRLVCPSCEAKYEVPDDAIPDSGRDVQCASCGHAWFQTRSRPVSTPLPLAAVADPDPAAEPAPEAVSEAAKPAAEDPASVSKTAAEAAPADARKAEKKPKTAEAPPVEAPPAEMAAVPEAATAPEPAVEATAAVDDPAGPAVDEKVLTILREEAEREAKARRGEAPAVESQPDLGVDAAAAPRKKGSAKRREPEPEPEAEKPSARRDLLPDVEEINSTLRPSEEPESEFVGRQQDTESYEQRGGFRAGFMLVISFALLGTVLYISAGRLSALVPAISGLLDGYVGFVDGLRQSLDGLMQAATRLISGDNG